MALWHSADLSLLDTTMIKYDIAIKFKTNCEIIFHNPKHSNFHAILLKPVPKLRPVRHFVNNEKNNIFKKNLLICYSVMKHFTMKCFSIFN